MNESLGNTQKAMLGCDVCYPKQKACQGCLSQAEGVQTLHPASITLLRVGCPPREPVLRDSQLLSARANSEEACLSPGKGLAGILFRPPTHPSCLMQMHQHKYQGLSLASAFSPHEERLRGCDWSAQRQEESIQVPVCWPHVVCSCFKSAAFSVDIK